MNHLITSTSWITSLSGQCWWQLLPHISTLHLECKKQIMVTQAPPSKQQVSLPNKKLHDEHVWPLDFCERLHEGILRNTEEETNTQVLHFKSVKTECSREALALCDASRCSRLCYNLRVKRVDKLYLPMKIKTGYTTPPIPQKLITHKLNVGVTLLSFCKRSTTTFTDNVINL